MVGAAPLAAPGRSLIWDEQPAALIANTLYMSTRSVEAHLTKVYRESGVHSRSRSLVATLAAVKAADTDSAADSNGSSGTTQ